jgi:hypothetical protein
LVVRERQGLRRERGEERRSIREVFAGAEGRKALETRWKVDTHGDRGDLNWTIPGVVRSVETASKGSIAVGSHHQKDSTPINLAPGDRR